MSSTYLELTNQVAVQLNETALNSSNFASASGIYSAIKNAVNYSIDHINHQQFEWPFNFVEDNSQALTIGENFYSFPANYKVADWNSFYIYNDGTLNTDTKIIRLTSKDIFHKYGKDYDLNHTTSGITYPSFVFPWGNRGYGVTPVPDKAYVLKFNYWKNPTRLAAYNDTTDIPNQFDYVIVLGALWYLNIFKEDDQGSSLIKEKFENALKTMRTVLINVQEDVVDTRVNHTGRFGVYNNSIMTG